MKLNKIFYAAAICLFGLVACEKEAEWTPTAPEEGVSAVYFPTIDETGQEVEPGAVTSHDVVVSRVDSTAELTLKIVVLENDNDVFTIPETVTFAAGQKTTTIPVTFGAMDVAIEYGFAISLEGVSLYKDIFYQYSITNIKYELGKGVFVDDIISGVAWYVDYKVASFSDGSKQFVIINPYIAPPAGAEAVDDELGVYDADPNYKYGIQDGTDYNLIITVAPNGDALMEPQLIGLVDEDGAYVAGSIHFIFNAPETFGVLTPGKSLIFSSADQALGRYQVGQSSGYAAGFELYLSKEAYVETLEPEGPAFTVDAEKEDYEGTYLLNCANDTLNVTFPTPVTIQGMDVKGTYYYFIEGLPQAASVLAFYDTITHALTVPAQNLDSIEYQGAPFAATLYTMVPSAKGPTFDQTGEAVLQFVPNADGSLSLHGLSPAIGFITYISNAQLQLGGFLSDGFLDLNLIPCGPALAPAKREMPAFGLAKTKSFMSHQVKDNVLFQK